MTDKERLIELLDGYYSEEAGNVFCYFTEKECEELADYLIKNGVIVLPVPVGSSCRIRKVIVGVKKINRVDFEEAVVDGVCLLTKSKSGTQIMSTENVFPTGGNSDNG